MLSCFYMVSETALHSTDNGKLSSSETDNTLKAHNLTEGGWVDDTNPVQLAGTLEQFTV